VMNPFKCWRSVVINVVTLQRARMNRSINGWPNLFETIICNCEEWQMNWCQIYLRQNYMKLHTREADGCNLKFATHSIAYSFTITICNKLQ
jgi:hypothetical protein